MGKGICVAGNMIVDIHYPVDGWPQIGELVHIRGSIERSTGGAVCNTIVDLAKLDSNLNLSALGRIGADAEGDLILDTLGAYKNISLDNVIRRGTSALTLVMSGNASKQRTFFTYSGANGEFCEDDIVWENLNCDILHIGYILLLDALDQEDAVFGSKMARLLHAAQQRGIHTSIDVVSEAGDRFARLVVPALKYTDYCIINELEASQTTGIAVRTEEGALIRENLLPILRRMKQMGVGKWTVIHAPEGGFGLDERDQYIEVKSLKLPEGYIRGTVGAGDAFCAGVLCGAENGWDLRTSLKCGVSAAAASLHEANATDGVCSIEDARALYEKYRIE